MNFPYQCMCKNSGVSQGVAYGSVAVKCHHQQDPRLVNKSGREEEYLTNAAIQGELSSMEPGDCQGLRDSAHREDKVCSRQHAEEEEHGFMEAVLGEDNEEETYLSLKVIIPKSGTSLQKSTGQSCIPIGQR